MRDSGTNSGEERYGIKESNISANVVMVCPRIIVPISILIPRITKKTHLTTHGKRNIAVIQNGSNNIKNVAMFSLSYPILLCSVSTRSLMYNFKKSEKEVTNAIDKNSRTLSD